MWFAPEYDTTRAVSEFPFRLAVFDLDGTLIDSSLDLILSVNATLRHLGRDELVLRGLVTAVPLAGRVVALLGANGAGKTTTLRAVSGLVRPRAGTIRFADRELHEHPRAI